MLTDSVRRRPYSVVLFDEIEKVRQPYWAHHRCACPNPGPNPAPFCCPLADCNCEKEANPIRCYTCRYVPQAHPDFWSVLLQNLAEPEPPLPSHTLCTPVLITRAPPTRRRTWTCSMCCCRSWTTAASRAHAPPLIHTRPNTRAPPTRRRTWTCSTCCCRS